MTEVGERVDAVDAGCSPHNHANRGVAHGVSAMLQSLRSCRVAADAARITLGTMTDKTNHELRRLADEIRVRIHLAGMDLKDAWKRLEPRVSELEHRIEQRFDRDAKDTTDNLAEIADTLHEELQKLHARLFPA